MDYKSVLGSHRCSKLDLMLACIDLIINHLLEYLALLIGIIDICVSVCGLTVGPQVVSFCGASHISLGSLLSSVLLIVGIFEVI
jgi:hypothetical protein